MKKPTGRVKAAPNSMGKPPYHDPQPARMSRTVGKGPGGDTFRVPNGAKYGTGEGVAPTRMDRSGGTGKPGNTFRQGTGRACKSSRKDTGANTDQPKRYGTEGVNVADAGKKQSQHGGTFGGKGTVAGDTGRYGGS